MERIRRSFYWPGTTCQIREFVSECQTCKETKPANVVSRPRMGAATKYERPFQRLDMDLLGSYSRTKERYIGLLFNDVFYHYGIHHMYTVIYSPQSNASKRVNRSLISGILSYPDNHRKWTQHRHLIGGAFSIFHAVGSVNDN